MKTLFLGTPALAVPCLEVISKQTDLALVVTQPDRPRGRQRKVSPPPVKVAALKLGLKVSQPEKISSPAFRQELVALQPELIVVVAFKPILPGWLLGLPPKGCINVHPSLLPRYRGAAPIEWAIIRGEKETGVTTLFVSPKLDAGDMILRRSVSIDPGETAGELTGRLSLLAAEILGETVELIREGKVKRIPQEGAAATFAPSLTREDTCIDWKKSAEEISNLIRGLNPRQGAYAICSRGKKGEKALKIWRASAHPLPAGRGEKASPGEIVEIISGGGPVVKTGKGFLLVRELQLEGGRRMPAGEYLRGRSLKEGERLGN